MFLLLCVFVCRESAYACVFFVCFVCVCEREGAYTYVCVCFFSATSWESWVTNMGWMLLLVVVVFLSKRFVIVKYCCMKVIYKRLQTIINEGL